MNSEQIIYIIIPIPEKAFFTEPLAIKGIFHRTTCYICNAITEKERNESKGWEGCLHYKSSCSWN